MTVKSLLSLSLGLVLALAPAVSFAQAPAATFTPEAEAALAKEPPLTQADVDGYIKLLPKITAAAANPAAAAELYKEVGWTEIHFSYVMAKLGFAQALAMGMPAEALQMDKIPQALRPSEAEVTLVKNNLPALQKAAADAAAKFQQ